MLPIHLRSLSWDLPLVLKALSRAPFEPLGNCSLKTLTQKIVFLVGIVSELAAFSMAWERYLPSWSSTLTPLFSRR